jgi:hypothetical protein
MAAILEFLLKHCPFLWEHDRYRFVHSEVAESFGGDALLILESESLRLRFTRDRGQLLLTLQATEPGAEWFSVDLIWRMLAGEKPESAELNEEYAAFLAENLDEIERRFGRPRYERTAAELRELELERARELFG